MARLDVVYYGVIGCVMVYVVTVCGVMLRYGMVCIVLVCCGV